MHPDAEKMLGLMAYLNGVDSCGCIAGGRHACGLPGIALPVAKTGRLQLSNAQPPTPDESRPGLTESDGSSRARGAA